MNYSIIGAAIGGAKGGTKLWFNPLRLTNTGEDVATVAFTDDLSAGTVLSYRKNDKGKFTAWDLSAITLQPGEFIELCGDNIARNNFIGHFSMTGTSIAASGTVMSLVYGVDMTAEQNTIMPYGAFGASTFKTFGLFKDCAILTSAPELPATTLAGSCYLGMFSGCTSLTSAPGLPATTLATSCYSSMFSGCTSLTSAPELPATTLAGSCYMFMFSGCTELQSVSVGFADWGSGSTDSWLDGVAAEGTFTCPAGLDTTTRDASHVPADWTVVNA